MKNFHCGTLQTVVHTKFIRLVRYFASLQKELCSPASVKSWNLVFSDNIFTLLFMSCHTQVHGYFLHWPCGDCSGGCIACRALLCYMECMNQHTKFSEECKKEKLQT